jgi:hypothetical protein
VAPQSQKVDLGLYTNASLEPTLFGPPKNKPANKASMELIRYKAGPVLRLS